ncbi:TrkH family potassium uptake protein [Natrarchaeobaculum sulfurireducens]|uniref:Trk-type K+ transport system, membrane component n=1 Tax=Natrarchaeobaculum sulfurireducens TaxID=2044521 RepID=A0A346PB30_9EURY|nr:TrkH family potassium uptake protein [Natrarchaeobaculum sulfurireducens]AXR76725.1 Trk-type K+ transport system, membrane component [Natrarchaeobaculum sulfurireducens]
MKIRVDWRSSCSLTGTVLKWLAVPLAVPLGLAVLDGDDPVPFLVAISVTVAVGLTLERLSDDRELGQRESFLMVAVTWLAVAAVGAIPFLLVGLASGGQSSFAGPVNGPVNAMFESTSGLTTTGATVMNEWDFAEQPRSVLLWRQLIQWLGGLGILIVAIGLLSHLMIGGAQLMETETQTRNVRKLRPHIAETARLIWGLYVGLTLLAIAVFYALHLLGLAPNMDFFNAVSHAFTSVATAGFSPEPDSIGAFSPTVQWSIIPFMVVGSTNFVLLYYLTQGDFERPVESEELRFYLGTLAFFGVVVVAILAFDPEIEKGLEPTIRHGLFNVASLLTTTGYASTDFDAWTAGAKHALFLCMFLGGMAGSTTCSIKSFRWLIVLKAFRRNLFTAVHPRAIRPVRLGDGVVDEDTVNDVFAYVLLAIVIFFVLTVFLVVDAARAGAFVGEFEALGAAASIFLNIGPAFERAGPLESYAWFPASSRAVMIVMMWIGRIEIIPVLVLLTPAFWKS